MLSRRKGVFAPGVAVGVEDIGDRSERTAYVVASKSLPQGIRLHVGGGNGNYDGVFFAIEKNWCHYRLAEFFRIVL